MRLATTTSVTPRILIGECVRLGIDRRTLLTQAGISSFQPISRMARDFPLEHMLALWEAILRLVPDQMFAVHTAKTLRFGAYGVLDYMLSSSSCPRDALERSARSFRLVNSAFNLSFYLHRELGYLELEYPENPRDLPRPYVEYIFTNYLTRLRFATQSSLTPLVVEVAYKEPAAASVYENTFGAPFRFGQPTNRMIFRRHLMELPHPLADADLCELLDEHIQQKAGQSARGTERWLQVREVISAYLKRGNVTLAHVARQVGMSSRALQRELYANGTTFRELLGSVRRERALKLLADSGMPLAEVASELKFSSTSAFCHAFESWMGCSPGAHRKLRRSGRLANARSFWGCAGLQSKRFPL